jgi:putative membrane protein
MKPRELFSGPDRERIAKAIADAESKTSGEIVPVVAGASGRYDRAEDIVGVLFALALLTAGWLGLQVANPPAGPWSSGSTHPVGLGLVWALLVGGFILGAAIASRVTVLRLPFIPAAEMREEVERSAQAAFHRYRLRETAGATGILIYVSLDEHQVRVLGDSAIAAKLGDADWQAICNAVTYGMKRGQATDGLLRGIELAGELLARHFPRESGDRDELVNELILID